MAQCPSGHESQTTDYCDTCGALMGGALITPTASAGPASAHAGSSAGSASGSASGSGASGEVCPYCGTTRSGRFCEEDGYDFELAELLPPGSVSAAPPPAPPTPPSTPTPTPEPLAPPSSTPQAPTPPAPAPPTLQPDPPLAPPPLTPPPAALDPLAKTAVLTPDGDPGSAAPPAPETPVPEPTAGGVLAAVALADQDYYNAQVQRGDIVESEFPFPRYAGERRFALDADRIRIGRASSSRGIVVEIDLTGPPLDPAVSHLHAQLLRGPDGSWSLVDLNSANGTRLNGAEDPIPAETEVAVKAGDRIHLGVWTTLTLEES